MHSVTLVQLLTRQEQDNTSGDRQQPKSLWGISAKSAPLCAQRLARTKVRRRQRRFSCGEKEGSWMCISCGWSHEGGDARVRKPVCWSQLWHPPGLRRRNFSSSSQGSATWWLKWPGGEVRSAFPWSIWHFWPTLPQLPLVTCSCGALTRWLRPCEKIKWQNHYTENIQKVWVY